MHRGLDLLDVAGQHVGAELGIVVFQQAADEGLLLRLGRGRAVWQPDQPGQPAVAALARGQLVLQHADRLVALAVGHRAVDRAHQVDGQRALRQQGCAVGLEAGFVVARQGAFGQHPQPVQAQLGLQLAAGLAAVGAALGQVDRRPGGPQQRGVVGGAAGVDLQGLELLRQLPGQDANHAEIALGKAQAIGRVQLQRGAVAVGVELIALGLAHLRGQRRLVVHRCLDHLEDPRLVARCQAAAARGLGAEAGQLALAPIRGQIARRQHRHQQGGAAELLDDLIGEHVIAAQLVIPPDAGLAAQAHAQLCLQRGMEARDPALLLGGERLVVDVGITDEQIVVEGHGSHRWRGSAGRPSVRSVRCRPPPRQSPTRPAAAPASLRRRTEVVRPAPAFPALAGEAGAR